MFNLIYRYLEKCIEEPISNKINTRFEHRQFKLGTQEVQKGFVQYISTLYTSLLSTRTVYSVHPTPVHESLQYSVRQWAANVHNDWIHSSTEAVWFVDPDEQFGVPTVQEDSGYQS